MFNKQKPAIKANSGLIALTSVVVISAVIVFLMVGIFRTSVGEMWRGEMKERGEEALSLANLCMEIALNELRKDPEGYAGSEIHSFTGIGQCEILAVQRGDDIIITTEGTTETTGKIVPYPYIRKLQADISATAPSIQIESWQEIE